MTREMLVVVVVVVVVVVGNEWVVVVDTQNLSSGLGTLWVFKRK